MSKPKKNKSRSKKDEGGRPSKYKNQALLTKAIAAYFNECIERGFRPSKAGLRVFLNIGKTTYSDYKKRFPNPIKRAEDIIEEAWVQRLDGQAATGAIFYLKNAFGEDYKDKQEHDHNPGGKPIQIQFDNAFTSPPKADSGK